MQAECSSLRDKNQLLQKKCDQLEKEMEIVHWYQRVMEEGVDTKQMLKFYMNAKQRISELEKNHEIELDRVTGDLTNTLEELEQTKDKLHKIKSEFLVPLLQEVKIKDEILKRQKDQKREFQEELKMLNAIIRLPRMCDQFQKALRRQTETESYAQMQAEAVSKLKPYINEDNEQEFMDDFLQKLDTKILMKLRNTSPETLGDKLETNFDRMIVPKSP